MSVQENSFPYPVRESRFFPLHTVVVLYFLSIPFFDLLNGILVIKFGISVVSMALKLLIFPILLLMTIAQFRIRHTFMRWVLAPMLILILMAMIRNSSRSIGLMLDDIFYLARGPILFCATYMLLAYMPSQTVRFISKWFFLISWLAMGISIALTAAFGIGKATHEGYEGAKGFYVAGNELTLIFSLSWWFVVGHCFSSKFVRIIITAGTFVLLILLGTKSGPVIAVILLCWAITHWLHLNPRFAVILSFVVSAVIMYYAEDIFMLLGPLHPSWNRLQHFIRKFGILEALTSNRIKWVQVGWTDISGFTLFKWIFGDGFTTFWNRTHGSSIECDIIDLLGSGGISLLAWFYGVLFCGLWHTTKPVISRKFIHSGAVLTMLLFSIFVGHVSFATTPMIMLALILADSAALIQETPEPQSTSS